jgi:hypothetical protein
MPRKTARKYKSSKKSRSSNSNRSSSRNSNRKTSNRRPRIRMVNHGFMKTVTTVDNKTSERELDWDGKYDGEKAIIHAKLNKDGKTETINKTFSDDEIKQLLGYSTVNEPLESRLKLHMNTNANTNTNMNKPIPVILNDDNMLFLEEPKQNPNPNHMRQFTIRI